MSVSDGLGMLDRQRERRARRIPASKNPPRGKPVAVPQAITPAPEHVTTGLEPVTSQPKPVRQESEPKAAKTSKSEPTPSVAEPTVKMSIYLEPADDLYLEDIAHTGKTSRPRVAISRSAIVRLALERLGATMTSDEIVQELRRRGEQHQGAGRKRR